MIHYNKIARILFSFLILISAFTVIDRELANAMPERLAKTAKAVDPRQVLCMAENIFYEAGKESYIGQIAVARVVMNRIHYGFASTPCAVVHQKITVSDKDGEGERVICQFSWTCMDVPPINHRNPEFQRIKKLAYQILAYNEYEDLLPKSTLFFHSTSVSPGWTYHRVTQIGNHIFYSKKKTNQKANEQLIQRSEQF